MNLMEDNCIPIQLLFPLRISNKVTETEKRKILSAFVKVVDFRNKDKPIKSLKPEPPENDLTTIKTEDESYDDDLMTIKNEELQIEEPQETEKDELIKEPKQKWEPVKKVNVRAVLSLSEIPSCRSKCTSRITLDDIKRLFNSYWRIHAREARLRYLIDMIDIRRASVWKNNINKPTRISSYTSFKIKTNEGHQKICRICLHRILNESTKFISLAVEKKWRELKNADEPQNNVVQEKENSYDINNSTSVVPNQEQSMALENVEPVDPDVFLRTEKLSKGPFRLSPCPAKCYLKINESDQIYIFKSYWQKSTLYSRLQFLNEMVIPVHYMHSKNDFLARERFSDSYYLNTEKGRIRVCKICFCIAIDEPVHFISAVYSEKLRKFKTNLINSIRDEKLRKGYSRLAPCPNNCYLRVTDGDQETIFETYWHNPTLYARLEFLNKMIKPVHFHDRKNQICDIYHLNTETGLHRVCKDCFALALDEPPHFISELLPEKLREFNEFKECMEEARCSSEQRVAEMYDDQRLSFSEFNSTYCIVKEGIDQGIDKVNEQPEPKRQKIVSDNINPN